MNENKQISKEEMEKFLGYKMPPRITDEEKEVLRAKFGGDDERIWTILKKVLLPSAYDSNQPIEYLVDSWLDIDFQVIPVNEAKAIILARQYMLKGVLGALLQLKNLANQRGEMTAEELAKKMERDSSK